MDTAISIFVKITVEVMLLPFYVFMVWLFSTLTDTPMMWWVMLYMGIVVSNILSPLEAIIQPKIRQYRERLLNASE